MSPSTCHPVGVPQGEEKEVKKSTVRESQRKRAVGERERWRQGAARGGGAERVRAMHISCRRAAQAARCAVGGMASAWAYREAKQQAGLADARVSDEYEDEKVVIWHQKQSTGTRVSTLARQGLAGAKRWRRGGCAQSAFILDPERPTKKLGAVLKRFLLLANPPQVRKIRRMAILTEIQRREQKHVRCRPCPRRAELAAVAAAVAVQQLPPVANTRRRPRLQAP